MRKNVHHSSTLAASLGSMILIAMVGLYFILRLAWIDISQFDTLTQAERAKEVIADLR